MIKFLVEDTYPTYRVTFFYPNTNAVAFLTGDAMRVTSIDSVTEEDIDSAVFGFLPDAPKEQIFEWPSK